MNLFEVGNNSKRYYIVAHNLDQAIEISKHAFKLRSDTKRFYAVPVYTIYLMIGKSLPASDILDSIGATTGYLDCSGTATQEYADGFKWYPFTQFSVRNHFIDIALASI